MKLYSVRIAAAGLAAASAITLGAVVPAQAAPAHAVASARPRIVTLSCQGRRIPAPFPRPAGMRITGCRQTSKNIVVRTRLNRPMENVTFWRQRLPRRGWAIRRIRVIETALGIRRYIINFHGHGRQPNTINTIGLNAVITFDRS